MLPQSRAILSYKHALISTLAVSDIRTRADRVGSLTYCAPHKRKAHLEKPTLPSFI
jgi:hypothetical protein